MTDQMCHNSNVLQKQRLRRQLMLTTPALEGLIVKDPNLRGGRAIIGWNRRDRPHRRGLL